MANSSSSNGGVPPGFRFHPTDEELLHYYLKKKMSFEKFDMEVVREVDLNKMEPWDLQEKCKIGSTPQNEWYLFSHKDKKYPTGSRTNRATNAGFWKATGRDKCIRTTYKKIGMRKTLVFYRGRAPHGNKTDWIMHEYRLEDGDDLEGNSNEDGWVICRVFKKKNLFKIGGNGGVGGGSGMNSSSDHQQLNNQAVTFMHMRDNQYYLHQPQTTTFELNKQPELGLNYSHLPTPQYSLFQSQSLLPLAYTGLNPSDDSNAMVKQLMTNPRDCDESGSESLRYQTAANCEPGLEVGTGREREGMNDQWTMAIDRIVTNTHHLGNQDSKGVRFDHNQQVNNANATSINQVNQLSLGGEMDFWGYEK